jgi:hypothetical protein
MTLLPRHFAALLALGTVSCAVAEAQIPPRRPVPPDASHFDAGSTRPRVDAGTRPDVTVSDVVRLRPRDAQANDVAAAHHDASEPTDTRRPPLRLPDPPVTGPQSPVLGGPGHGREPHMPHGLDSGATPLR